MAYVPRPIDTSRIELPDELLELTELLAENTHNLWANRRISENWSHGRNLDEESKTHPCLIPYSELPDSEKEYDRMTAMEALKVVVALGYDIRKRQETR